MGLLTDIFFIKALKSNEELISKLSAGDIYDNVAEPDFDMENVKLPYIIVNRDPGNNDRTTKDEQYEGAEDRVNVSIRIAARNRMELARLELMTRKTVLDYITAADDREASGEPMPGDELKPIDYTFRMSDVMHDMQKPAHISVLYYDCITTNELFIENLNL